MFIGSGHAAGMRLRELIGNIIQQRNDAREKRDDLAVEAEESTDMTAKSLTKMQRKTLSAMLCTEHYTAENTNGNVQRAGAEMCADAITAALAICDHHAEALARTCATCRFAGEPDEFAGRYCSMTVGQNWTDNHVPLRNSKGELWTCAGYQPKEKA